MADNVLLGIGPQVIAGVITILLVDQLRKSMEKSPNGQFTVAPIQTTPLSPLEAGESRRGIFPNFRG